MALNSRLHYEMKPEQTAKRREKYNAHLRRAPGAYSAVDLSAIRERQQDCCFYCGKNLDGKGEADHKTPLSRGGTNYPHNIALACITCNRDKSNKTESEFFEWRSRLDL